MEVSKLIDLHVHTNESGGAYSPQEIVDMAREKNIGVLAITDIGTIKGAEIALEYAKRYNDIRIITGVEIIVDSAWPVHIVGLYVDPNSYMLRDFLSKLEEAQIAKNMNYINILAKREIIISLEEVAQYAEGKRIEDIHFAKCLTDKEYFPSIKNAMNYIQGYAFKQAKNVSNVTLEDAIRVIKLAGGVPVLTQTFEERKEVYQVNYMLQKAICYGIEAIEVNHPCHTKIDREICNRYVDKYNLLVAGGSDFYGKDKRKDCELGTGIAGNAICLDYYMLDKIEAKHKERWQRTISL